MQDRSIGSKESRVNIKFRFYAFPAIAKISLKPTAVIF